MTKTSISTDQMFCMAVYAAAHAVNQAYADHLQALGLTYPQYAALLLVREQDGLTVSDLSRQMHLGSSTLSPMLKRMEAEGLLSRRRSATDERSVQVFLAEAGRALVQDSGRITRCMIDQTGLPVAELEALVQSLQALTRGLAGEGGPRPASEG